MTSNDFPVESVKHTKALLLEAPKRRECEPRHKYLNLVELIQTSSIFFFQAAVRAKYIKDNKFMILVL